MLIAELVIALATLPMLIVPVIAAFINIAVLIISIPIELLLYWLGYKVERKRAARPVKRRSAGEEIDAAPPMVAMSPRVRWWLRCAGCVAAAGVTCIMAFILVLNLFFFEATVRTLLDRAQARAGMQVSFQAAQGNLFLGRIELSGLTLQRQGHHAFDFDITADRLLIDVELLSLLGRTRRVHVAEAEGVAGQLDRVGVGQQRQSPWVARRNVRIETLGLYDVDVTFIDHTVKNAPLTMPVHVDSMVSRPLRSQWIAYDLLFHTNGSGQIDNSPFELAVTRSPQGGQTQWLVQALPAAAAASFIGGPFQWLDAGNVNVDVVNHWGPKGSQTLGSAWKIELRNVQATAPAMQGGLAGHVAEAAVKHINEHGDHLPLSFSFELTPQQFEGSLDASGLWEAVAEAAATELSRQVMTGTVIGELQHHAADGLQRFVERRRSQQSAAEQPPSQDEEP